MQTVSLELAPSLKTTNGSFIYWYSPLQSGRIFLFIHNSPAVDTHTHRKGKRFV